MESKCSPMLTKLSHDEVPDATRKYSANTEFAREAVLMFLDLKCDAVKVDGWPLKRTASAYAGSLNSAIHYMNANSKVKAFSRRIDGVDGVYLERR